MSKSSRFADLTLPRLAGLRAAASSVAGVLLVAALVVVPGAKADDTEVFFPPEDITVEGLIRPNVLFMLDTSGSMGDGDGGSVSRIQRMREALTKMIQGLSPNVNIGLGRFSASQGGAILWPVSPIDAKVSEVDPGTAQQVFTIKIGPTAAEAVQNKSSNAVTVNAGELLFGSDGTGRIVGLRFPNVGIPRGVTILGAALEFTSMADGGTSATTLRVQGHANGNSPPLTNASNDLGSRTRTAASVDWAVESWGADDTAFGSVDVRNVVQEIVNRADWCGRNAMTLLLDHVSGSYRRAYSWAGDQSQSVTLNIAVSPTDPALGTGCQRLDVIHQINSSNDDAQQSPTTASGTVSLNGNTLNLGCTASSCSSSNNSYVALRFPAVNVAKNATILSAHIELTAASNDNSGSPSYTIVGEDVDNAAPFTSTNGSIRARRVAAPTGTVTWNSGSTPAMGAWSSGAVYQTPDLKTIVQNIVDNGGWAPGNAMAFFIEGSVRRRARSWNDSASSAPRLVIAVQGALGVGSELTVRQYLLQMVASLPDAGATPSVGVLYEAARYMRGEEAWYGKTRGGGPTYESPGDSQTLARVRLDGSIYTVNGGGLIRTSHRASFKAPLPTLTRSAGCTDILPGVENCKDERWVGTATYKSPLTHACQANSIVFLTDGEPNSSDVRDKSGGKHAKDLAMALTGVGSCAASAAGTHGQCATEIVNFLLTKDQAPSVPGTQTIKTYAVGFNLADNPSAMQFLNQIAVAGGTGQAYEASSAEGLANVFQSIIAQILDVNTTFVSPGVTVNTFNRLTHRNELYFALFRPSPQVKWDGNLKRYQISGSPLRIRDVNGADAVDDSTGFFRDTARSYWSSLVDGSDAAKGGFASRLPDDSATRRIYTYIGGSPTNVGLTGHPFTTGNAAITKSLLGIDTETDAYRNNLIEWARGRDGDDVNGNGNFTEARRQIGDPLHSEPLLITYQGPADNPQIGIFFGTNEGFLHGLNASDGSEIFSFIPQELLGNLNKFFVDNTGYKTRPYGLDGPITAWVNDLNSDGVILSGAGSPQAGEHAYVYAGMRRGGNNYYAFDVTNRTAPVLKFMIEGGTGAYKELAQTWSRGVVTKVKINGTVRQVLVFTGGYDVAQDTKTKITADGVGRAVFIADAATGQRLWWAGPSSATDGSGSTPDLKLNTMQFSVPASPKVVDLDFDGIADRIYIADTGGQVHRIILDKAATSAANLAKGQLFATLGDADQPEASRLVANGRRFFAPPDVALITKGVTKPFLSVSLGSGFREKPLSQNIQDRFYVLRDPDVSATTTTTPPVIKEGDLFNATDVPVLSDGQRQVVIDITKTPGVYIELREGGSFKGEKVFTESRTFNNQVLFTSFTPGLAAGQCSASTGRSKLYAISVVDASPVQKFDNGDNKTKGDRDTDLAQAGLAPNIALLFIGNEVKPCIGAECPNVNLGTVTTDKYYWIKQE